MGLVGCSSSCNCVSVSVTFDDGTSSVNWRWVRQGRSIRFGSTMHVKWTVYGSSERCKYFQRETGNFTWFRDNRDPRVKSARWTDHEASRKDTGPIGGYFYSPADNGTWQSRDFRAPTLTQECQSSDGTRITQTITVQSPPVPGLFAPPKQQTRRNSSALRLFRAWWHYKWAVGIPIVFNSCTSVQLKPPQTYPR